MPYIIPEDREAIDTMIDNLAESLDQKGEVNYTITRLIHRFVEKQSGGKCYNNCNDAVGIMACALLEFYVQVVKPYEDKKIADNGDIGIL